MTFVAIFLILYLLVGFASLRSRGAERHEYEDYHHDPYYYYPRNAPPSHFNGYYQQPMMPNFPAFPPQVRYASMRPQAQGSFFTGLLLFMVTAALLFGLGIKLGMVSLQLTLGNPPDNPQYEPHIVPKSPIERYQNEEGTMVYAKN
jgi:uncharacterized membrane protein YedE/YeeE